MGPLLLLAAAAAAAAPVVHHANGAHAIDFAERRGDYTLRHRNIGPHAVALSVDGTLAASGSSDGTIAIFDLADGHVVRTWDSKHRNVYTLALSPDGKHL